VFQEARATDNIALKKTPTSIFGRNLLPCAVAVAGTRKGSAFVAERYSLSNASFQITIHNGYLLNPAPGPHSDKNFTGFGNEICPDSKSDTRVSTRARLPLEPVLFQSVALEAGNTYDARVGSPNKEVPG
jgi:hypothetical protein